jgi:hypothetical protein
MNEDPFELRDSGTDSGQSRRRFLQTTAGVTLLTAVAGCSGGGQNGGDDGTGTPTDTEPASPTATETPAPTATETAAPTPSETASPTARATASPTASETSAATTTSGADPSIASRCQIDNNTSNLAVPGCQAEADEGDLLLTSTVRNEGEQKINLFEYTYRISAYEAAEAATRNNITENYNISYPNGREVGPEKTKALTVRVGLPESKTPEDVELYTVLVY